MHIFQCKCIFAEPIFCCFPVLWKIYGSSVSKGLNIAVSLIQRMTTQFNNIMSASHFQRKKCMSQNWQKMLSLVYWWTSKKSLYILCRKLMIKFKVQKIVRFLYFLKISFFKLYKTFVIYVHSLSNIKFKNIYLDNRVFMQK